MARARDLTCKCGATFTTRANPNVRVRCPACAEWHRAPSVENPWQGPASKAAPPAPPAPAADPPAGAPPGRAVTRAGRVNVRPAPPRAPSQPETSSPAARQRRAQEAGARGGRSTQEGGALGFVRGRLGR